MSDNNGSRKGGWVYDNPLTDSERKMKNDRYPWVSTSSFKSGANLGFHGHGSANTHLIVKGEVAFFTYDIVPRKGERPPRNDIRSSMSGLVVEGNYVNMNPKDMYSARVIDDCDFVEGHRCLSPSTRDRFLSRNAIKRSDDEEHVGPVTPEAEEQGNNTR